MKERPVNHKRSSQHQRRRASTVHPLLYRMIIGLTVLWIVVAWSFFAKHGYASLMLITVTFMGIMAIVLPAELFRIRRNHRNARHEPEQSLRPSFASFRRWLTRDL